MKNVNAPQLPLQREEEVHSTQRKEVHDEIFKKSTKNSEKHSVCSSLQAGDKSGNWEMTSMSTNQYNPEVL